MPEHTCEHYRGPGLWEEKCDIPMPFECDECPFPEMAKLRRQRDRLRDVCRFTYLAFRDLELKVGIDGDAVRGLDAAIKETEEG